MTTADYVLPAILPPALDAVRTYWQRLRRAENDIPFSDDVVTSQIPGTNEAALLTAFYNPLRFRFDAIGAALAEQAGKNITGKFVDEIGSREPFEGLGEQCVVAVRDRKPSYYSTSDRSRLVLPLWGNGRVDMLIVSVFDAA
jgi:hypothetical protein